jgi:hypothetical protein
MRRRFFRLCVNKEFNFLFTKTQHTPLFLYFVMNQIRSTFLARSCETNNPQDDNVFFLPHYSSLIYSFILIDFIDFYSLAQIYNFESIAEDIEKYIHFHSWN